MENDERVRVLESEWVAAVELVRTVREYCAECDNSVPDERHGAFLLSRMASLAEEIDGR